MQHDQPLKWIHSEENNSRFVGFQKGRGMSIFLGLFLTLREEAWAYLH